MLENFAKSITTFGLATVLVAFCSTSGTAAVFAGREKPLAQSSQVLLQVAESDEECDPGEDCSQETKKPSPKMKDKEKKPGAKTSEDCDPGEDCSSETD